MTALFEKMTVEKKVDVDASHQTLSDLITSRDDSSFRKYQRIFVGKPGIAALIKYELYTTLSSLFPGAIGYIVRKKMIGALLASRGKSFFVGPGITLRNPGAVHVGDNFVADQDVVLDAKGAISGITLGNSVFLGKGTILSCADAKITLGNDISIGAGCLIRASRGDVSLGDHITIGAQSVIISGNPDSKRTGVPMMHQSGNAKGITIGNDVWMGVGVRIVDGVTIGNGCVIGAGAVVVHDIEDYAIAAGVPAKTIKYRLD
jgi:acetyltransferase-like isoleucine patch superfamily enzyme